jgi:hypothetical protein
MAARILTPRCARCDAPFIRTRPNRLYCCARCRHQAHHKRRRSRPQTKPLRHQQNRRYRLRHLERERQRSREWRQRQRQIIESAPGLVIVPPRLPRRAFVLRSTTRRFDRDTIFMLEDTLRYLEKAEDKDRNFPQRREAYRLAWHIINSIYKGKPTSWETLFARMYGTHPGVLWPHLYSTKLPPKVAKLKPSRRRRA